MGHDADVSDPEQEEWRSKQTHLGVPTRLKTTICRITTYLDISGLATIRNDLTLSVSVDRFHYQQSKT